MIAVLVLLLGWFVMMGSPLIHAGSNDPCRIALAFVVFFGGAALVGLGLQIEGMP